MTLIERINTDKKISTPIILSFFFLKISVYQFNQVRHEACVYIYQIPLRMKEPYNPIGRSG